MSTLLEPTRSAERIGMLDTTRGIAVLGILLMNIIGFGLPNAYDDPTNWGGADGADLTVWRTMALFFEGTMRGLFTLLFGAGALLFLERHAVRSTGLRPADLYFRRTMWLIVFGLFNGYLLLWDGDILFYYGVTGLLLFVFRSMPARRLIVCAVAALALQSLVTTFEWTGYREIRDAAQSAQAAQMTGQALSTEQQEAVEVLNSIEGDFKPSRATQEDMIASMQESYRSAFGVISQRTWHTQTDFFFRHGLLDSLGMMLLGMALFRLGVLTGAASTRVYVVVALVGYALGLVVNLFETTNLERAGFSVEALFRSYVTYDLGRTPMTLGHVGLIGLMCRIPTLAAVARTFAAAGQMALTNYLSQSLICLFVFTGAGLALFGTLERHELYYVVGAIWIVQLVWSPLWLRHFRFGPAEWAWRSLTYWRRQPMRRMQAGAAPEVFSG
ncbi:MAG: DUF418 domain-containing protein [Steroidobacter sp.]